MKARFQIDTIERRRFWPNDATVELKQARMPNKLDEEEGGDPDERDAWLAANVGWRAPREGTDYNSHKMTILVPDDVAKDMNPGEWLVITVERES